MPIHHRGHVPPFAGDRQVCHVPDPHLVEGLRLCGVRLVRHAGEEGPLQHLGVAIKPCAAALQAGQAHQPGHAPASHGDAIEAQLPGHPRAAVEASATLVCFSHLLQERGVFTRSQTRLALLPCVETSACDAVQRAHHLDGPGLPVCRNEGEDFAFRSEANRMAFFRRSCSI